MIDDALSFALRCAVLKGDWMRAECVGRRLGCRLILRALRELGRRLVTRRSRLELR